MFNLELTEFNPYVLAYGMDYLTLANIDKSYKEVKASMERSRNFLVEITFEFGQNVEAIAALNAQLVIVNKNIENIHKALLMKEAVAFEYATEFEPLDLHIFCLN